MDNMLNDGRFCGLEDLNSFSMMLVETKRHENFPINLMYSWIIFAYQVDVDSSRCYDKC